MRWSTLRCIFLTTFLCSLGISQNPLKSFKPDPNDFVTEMKIISAKSNIFSFIIWVPPELLDSIPVGQDPPKELNEYTIIMAGHFSINPTEPIYRQDGDINANIRIFDLNGKAYKPIPEQKLNTAAANFSKAMLTRPAF